MGAVSVGTTVPVDKTMGQLLSGGRLPKGAKVKTFTITLPASYDAGGSTLDLSAHFKDRIWFAAPMAPFAINASTGAVYVGLVPGTAKTDGQGGFSAADWKVRAAATATESTGAANLGAYTFTMFAVGQ
jgi:hypothetical protein